MKRMIRILGFPLLLACLLVPCIATATPVQVQATLDRNQVTLGQTVALTVQVNGATDRVAPPDLGALAVDFEVLGSSQNRSLSIVNGVRQSQLSFGFALRPRRAGTLTIPALTVAGAQTTPLGVTVTAAAPLAAGDVPANAEVFLQVQTEPAQVHVGQQVSYVLRLFHAVDLSGALDSPQVDGARTVKLGDDIKYVEQRGGRSFEVLERRFALIPQRAGKLLVPPVTFQGEASDPSDPGNFFGSGTPVSAQGPQVAIDVQAAPAVAGGDAWLPARGLTLTMSGADGSQPVRVGQPINLTLVLRAVGLGADALPLPTLPTLDGATVYPDQVADSTRNQGPWLLGERRRAFAVVPERAGKLALPALRISWWNVLTGRAEVASIPARTLTVLPALGAAVATPSTPATGIPGDAASAPTAAMPAGAMPQRPTMPWRWIALGSGGLWVLSILAWWVLRRRTPAPPADSGSAARAATGRELRRAFVSATRTPDAAAQAHSLLAWARAERPALQHLGDLAAALADDAQRTAIAVLQRQCYASSSGPADGAVLATAFARGFVWREQAAAPPAGAVPPLYPFNLR